MLLARLGRTADDKVAAVKQQARRYFGLAQHLIHPPPPMLVAVGGLSGTGKSVLARALAPDVMPEPGAVVLRTDVQRKELFKAREDDRLPESAYRPEVTEQVYEMVAKRANGFSSRVTRSSSTQCLRGNRNAAGINESRGKAERPVLSACSSLPILRPLETCWCSGRTMRPTPRLRLRNFRRDTTAARWATGRWSTPAERPSKRCSDARPSLSVIPNRFVNLTHGHSHRAHWAVSDRPPGSLGGATMPALWPPLVMTPCTPVVRAPPLLAEQKRLRQQIEQWTPVPDRQTTCPATAV